MSLLSVPRRGAAFWVPIGLIALLLFLKLLATFRHEFDSDEAQHLHMIYGWLGGDLPYRDRFDNHTPLLYLLFLPFAALAGETPQVVLLARLAEIPVSLGMLGFIFLIARRLADREVALWTLVFTLAFADWSLKSVEFRPDVLWAFLWFAAIWQLVRPPDRISLGRAFAIGLLLGAAFCSSIKTSFLAPALAIGWGSAWVFSARMREAWPLCRLPAQAATIAFGFAIVPSALFGWLLSQGTTLATLRFCLLDANQAPFEIPRVIAAFVLAPLALAAAWWIARPPTLLAALRTAIFLSVTTYVIALFGFSPELRKQTFLVVWPLVILLLVIGGTALLRKHRPALILPISVAAFVVLLAHFIAESTLWNDGLRRHRELLTDAIKLTRPGDYLLDRKGETIFRERPVYVVYQHATLRGFNEGRLTEPPTSRLTETHTTAALVDAGGFPDKMRKYLKENFLPVGDDLLRVPGYLVKTFPENGHLVGRVNVPQVGNYVILTEGSPPQPFEVKTAGPQQIDLGPKGPRRILLLWKPAWDAGFPPSAKAWALLADSKSSAK